MPLGKLSSTTIQSGYAVLSEIEQAVRVRIALALEVK